MISILNKEEVKKFENEYPIFNISQKEYYFNIPDTLLNNIQYSDNKIFIILMYGYFKATNKFYKPDLEDKNLLYLRKKYNATILDNISKGTFYRFKQLIKQYLCISDYSDKIADTLLKEAITLASNFTHRRKIFYALVNLSKKLKIEVPSYTELSRIISLAINSQKKDILEKLTPFLDNEKLDVLDEFLQKDTASKNRWQLSHYKKLEHATNKKKMLASLSKFNTIKSKFQITQSIIEEIGLTPKIAQYHARWIEKSQVFQVKRKKDIESNFLLVDSWYSKYYI